MGNSIMHCGREYSGGGEIVVANPPGEATADLDTIQIGETIYDIPGSGGGSSGKGYSTTCIWDYVEDNSGVIPYAVGSVTLNDNINNYDMIIAELVSAASDLSDQNWHGTQLMQLDVNALNNSYNNNYWVYSSYDDRSSRFYISGTTFQKTTNNRENTNGLVRVYGVKYRGEGNGSFVDDIIYENTTGVSGASQQISITKAVSNYDALAVVLSTYNDGGYATRIESYYSPACVRGSNDFQCLWYPTYGNRWITLTGDPESTTVTLSTGVYGEGSGYTPIVYEVHGIKYGGSGDGTDVEANPQDTPTDTLETIKIGDTVYDIAGGGSGDGYNRTSLWSGTQSTAGQIALNDDINNYDALEFITKLSNGAHNTVVVDAKSFTTDYPYTSSVSANIPHYCLLGYDNCFARIIAGSTSSSLYVWDFLDLYLAEVNGIKYGGGGTDVEANPQDTPTDTLETIKIGETTYNISGSSGSSGYVEDVLFKPSTPSSTSSWSSPVSTGISKSEVDDYDMLVFGVGADDHTRTFGFIPVSRLNDSSRSSVAITTSEQMNSKSCYAGYDSNNVLCVYTNTGTSTYVFDVTGIKYGCGTVFKCDSIALPTLYSENEKIVGIWTDGKPLYQKTFEFTISTVSDWTLFDNSVSYDNLIKAYGSIVSSTAAFPIVSNFNDEPRWSIQNNQLMYYYNGTQRQGSITFLYTKTTDQPVDQFDLSMFGIYSPVIYSMTEREIGVWTDGKPLYQKTIDCGAMTVDTNTHDVAHNISNIDKVVFVCGIGFNSSNESFPLPNYRPNTQSGILFMADRTNVTYMNNWTAVSAAYATIRYTKTTDVPGSGSYTELGVPAVHYNDTEKVIGTFFGEPLYEKSYKVTSITGTGVQLDTISDLKELVSGNGTFKRNSGGSHLWYEIDGRTETADYNNYGFYIHTASANQIVVSFTGYSSSEIEEIIVTIRYTKTTD